MAGGTIDDGGVGHILAIVDEDGPDVDEKEQSHVAELLQREQEREHVVGYGLTPAIHWVKGMRSVGCRHDPLVVWLVEGFVY